MSTLNTLLSLPVILVALNIRFTIRFFCLCPRTAISYSKIINPIASRLPANQYRDWYKELNCSFGYSLRSHFG